MRCMRSVVVTFAILTSAINGAPEDDKNWRQNNYREQEFGFQPRKFIGKLAAKFDVDFLGTFHGLADAAFKHNKNENTFKRGKITLQ